VAAAVLPGRAGPPALLSGCRGLHWLQCATGSAWVLGVWAAQATGTGSPPAEPAAWLTEVCEPPLRAASPRPGPAAPGRPLKGGFKAWDSNFRKSCYTILSRLPSR